MPILGNYSTVQNARDSIGWILFRWRHYIFTIGSEICFVEVHELPTSFIEVFLCRHIILTIERQMCTVLFSWCYYHSRFFSRMENTISKADELKLMMSNTTHFFCPSKIHLSIYIYTHHNLAYLVGAFNPIEKQYDRQIWFHFPNRWGWKYQKCLSCHWFFDIVNCNGSNSNIPCFIPLLLAQKKLQYQKWGCTFPQLLLSWCFIGWTPPSPHLGWCRRSAWRRGALLAAIWRPTTASI